MFIHLHANVIVVYKHLHIEIPGIFAGQKNKHLYFYIGMGSMLTQGLL